MVAKPKSIDAYLAPLPADRREALEQLRRLIKTLAPDAEECISYSMPAFRVGGQVVAGFLATSKGCSYYPFSGRTLTTLAAEVADYKQTKGALHFDPKRGLPKALVRKLITTRLAEGPRPKVKAKAKAKPKPSPKTRQAKTVARLEVAPSTNRRKKR